MRLLLPQRKSDSIIGYIPGTNYPAIINKQYAVTHHTAIVGITGSGKSVFARNLINQISNDETEVIIVDLTGEYKEKIPGLSTIISNQDSKIVSDAIETLAQKMLNSQISAILQQFQCKKMLQSMSYLLYL